MNIRFTMQDENIAAEYLARTMFKQELASLPPYVQDVCFRAVNHILRMVRERNPVSN